MNFTCIALAISLASYRGNGFRVFATNTRISQRFLQLKHGHLASPCDDAHNAHPSRYHRLLLIDLHAPPVYDRLPCLNYVLHISGFHVIFILRQQLEPNHEYDACLMGLDVPQGQDLLGSCAIGLPTCDTSVARLW